MLANQLVIRPGKRDDLPGLTDLYNHYILHTAATFDIEPYTVETRRDWFDSFKSTGRYRLVVAEHDGSVVGYASSGRYRKKAAYDATIETSVYVHPDATAQGIGQRLYEGLFDALEGEDVHRALAGVTLPNEPSIRCHERCGFRPVATFREVGRKFGRYWDVLWMEKVFE